MLLGFQPLVARTNLRSMQRILMRFGAMVIGTIVCVAAYADESFEEELSSAMDWSKNSVSRGPASDRYTCPTSCRQLRVSSANPNLGSFGNTRNQGTKFHAGIDISCPHGLEAVAIADGGVFSLGSRSKGYGDFVLTEHWIGGVKYHVVYAHLLTPDATLELGFHSFPTTHDLGPLRLSAGDTVGLIGTSGNSDRDDPHLHIEVWKGGYVLPSRRKLKVDARPIDPLKFFNRLDLTCLD